MYLFWSDEACFIACYKLAKLKPRAIVRLSLRASSLERSGGGVGKRKESIVCNHVFGIWISASKKSMQNADWRDDISNDVTVLGACLVSSVFQCLQPRSQSSSAILDVTSPVKFVGKVRRGRLANNGKSKMAAPRMRLQPRFLKKWKKASEIGWDSLINVCHQIHRDVGEISFKESFRVYTCYYRRSVISSFDCIKKYGFNSAQQIVASQECVHVPLNVPGEGSCLSGMS